MRASEDFEDRMQSEIDARFPDQRLRWAPLINSGGESTADHTFAYQPSDYAPDGCELDLEFVFIPEPVFLLIHNSQEFKAETFGFVFSIREAGSKSPVRVYQDKTCEECSCPACVGHYYDEAVLAFEAYCYKQNGTKYICIYDYYDIFSKDFPGKIPSLRKIGDSARSVLSKNKLLLELYDLIAD
ncbi:hypothetical protein QEL91_002013 [Pseudomonas putida]|nr:hypothetical protein [Pseudomonas putida]